MTASTRESVSSLFHCRLAEEQKASVLVNLSMHKTDNYQHHKYMTVHLLID